jgi:hypothetical protein
MIVDHKGLTLLYYQISRNRGSGFFLIETWRNQLQRTLGIPHSPSTKELAALKEA